MKRILLKNLDDKKILMLHRFLSYVKTFFKPFDLNFLAKVYKTDKLGDHFYTPHYSTHFKKFRRKKINLLEIGVGGYENPIFGGHSLRMWKRYFPFGKIYSIDIFDKTQLAEHRIKIFQGSQTDLDFLNKVVNEIGTLDIIIDDGSHINSHVIESFEFLFPKLKNGGIYVVEDTQTSYWESYGGDHYHNNNPNTIVNYFKKFIDNLNNKEFDISEYKQNYYDKHIVSIHFYHNLIFIYKGENNEESNVIKNNYLPK